MLGPNTIKGWMLPEEIKWLQEQASKATNLIIEIGIWYGKSTYTLCSSTNARVIAIDNFKGSADSEGIEVYSPEDVRLAEIYARETLSEFIESYCITPGYGHDFSDIEINGDPRCIGCGKVPDQCKPKLTIIKSDSNKALDFSDFSKYQADMIFIDGDHTYAQVLRDILNYTPLLKPNGLLSGHDRQFPSVIRAVESCFGSNYQSGPGTIWYKRIN